MERDKLLLEIRPSISTIDIESPSSAEEYFQNTVIRQIMKLQHEAIISTFKSYVNTKKKSETYMAEVSITKETFHHLVDQLSFKDPGFLNTLAGLILGMMTMPEMDTYMLNHAEYRRRIFTMSKKKILRHWQLID